MRKNNNYENEPTFEPNRVRRTKPERSKQEKEGRKPRNKNHRDHMS